MLLFSNNRIVNILKIQTGCVCVYTDLQSCLICIACRVPRVPPIPVSTESFITKQDPTGIFFTLASGGFAACCAAPLMQDYTSSMSFSINPLLKEKEKVNFKGGMGLGVHERISISFV